MIKIQKIKDSPNGKCKAAAMVLQFHLRVILISGKSMVIELSSVTGVKCANVRRPKLAARAFYKNRKFN